MISVIVITKNEEERIKTCLESVKWADEIIIADTGSMDQTLEIAKDYTRNIFICKGKNFMEWRNEAMEKAKGEWILYLDADERILKPLKEEIEEIITNTDKSAFAISRRNIILGSEQKYGPFWPDWVIRLLKKNEFEGWIGEVHEYAKFKGELGYTKNSLLHLTHRNVEQMINKNLSWSKTDARLRFESGHPKMVGWRFLRIFFTELFFQGIIRRGFFSGTIGIIDSIIQTFSLFTSYVRLWEMQQNEPLDEKYKKIDQELVEKNFSY